MKKNKAFDEWKKWRKKFFLQFHRRENKYRRKKRFHWKKKWEKKTRMDLAEPVRVLTGTVWDFSSCSLHLIQALRDFKVTWPKRIDMRLRHSNIQFTFPTFFSRSHNHQSLLFRSLFTSFRPTFRKSKTEWIVRGVKIAGEKKEGKEEKWGGKRLREKRTSLQSHRESQN